MVKPVWNNSQRVNHQNFAKKTHPCAKKNLVPRAVLMKSGLVLFNTARYNILKIAVLVNTARQVNVAHSKTTVNDARPMGKNVNTARPKAVVNAVKGNNFNAVKASACWVWKPKHKVLDHGNPQMDLQDQGVIDSGCSRHMTGNMSYLTDYEEIDGGYVAFGGNPKGGKITGKCTIKTGNLDFENVYFVRELKFNLFSVSQMCDKKNSVLFNDTECIVLSPNFKLIDESQVLLRVPRKNNMYSVDLKNIVPKVGLTCLFAKATSDESKHWHRRLGHLNFKSMNKLVKGNLVRGLPSKLFENDETCVACQKGKQHRASSRTPQQNGAAEGRNRTLIEAARTMLADSKLPITFWAEAVNTACYVKNRVLVVKPHNKTPYELFHGRTPTLSFLRPFGCPVTILNTIDHLGKFDGKTDEGFFVRYSLNSKAFRVFNSRTRIVEENLYIRFSESTPNAVGSGPDWLFDIDALTRTMNYEPIIAGTQSNGFASTKASDNAGQARNETEPVKDYILLTLWIADLPFSQNTKSSHDDGSKPSSDDEKKVDEDLRKDSESNDQEKEDNVNNTNNVNAASTNKVNAIGGKTSIKKQALNFTRDDEDDGEEPKKVIQALKKSKLDRCYAGRASIIQVTRRYTQEEGIDYDEVFSPVARIEAIRLFLAYASFKDFVVYQIYVKSSFLYGKIEEEVYVCQPSGFEDPDFPDRVYKVEKALYGLHQAPKAWYETLSTYLLDNGFQREKIDKTLFIKRHKDGKKIIITEASVRRDLQLADEEGVECLPNSTIFEQLALMGVLDLEKIKTTQQNEIASLKMRVKKLEKKSKDASKQGRIDDIDADEEITLVSVQNVDEEMFDVNVLDGEEVFVAEQEVSVKDVSNVVSIVGDATTVSAATTTTAIITIVDDITLAQDKGKEILIEPVKPMKKKDLIMLHEEVALNLQAEFDEEERLAREKAKKKKKPILP
ncbi:retrovirus-related pol polyprotein from transposon TNT 1-94 [Tanacetum coccineum]